MERRRNGKRVEMIADGEVGWEHGKLREYGGSG